MDCQIKLPNFCPKANRTAQFKLFVQCSNLGGLTANNILFIRSSANCTNKFKKENDDDGD
jgi:hypothetical protein